MEGQGTRIKVRHKSSKQNVQFCSSTSAHMALHLQSTWTLSWAASTHCLDSLCRLPCSWYFQLSGNSSASISTFSLTALPCKRLPVCLEEHVVYCLTSQTLKNKVESSKTLSFLHHICLWKQHCVDNTLVRYQPEHCLGALRLQPCQPLFERPSTVTWIWENSF